MDAAKEVAVSTATWIYFGIGCFSLILALVSFLFTEIGDVFHDAVGPVSDWMGDHFSFGHDHEIEFSKFLNNGGILGFIAGFGFIAALAMSQFNLAALPAAGWGTLGGIIFGGFTGLFWYVLKRSEGTAGYNIKELVGQKGIVSEKIYQGGVGKVECVINNMQTWHTAIAEDRREILTGTTVIITKVVGSTIYVLPDPSKG